MQRKVWPPADTRSALAAFVDEHTGTIESGDVGPLIGLAALACEYGAGAVALVPEMQEPMNVALTSEALRAPSSVGATTTATRRATSHRPAPSQPPRAPPPDAPGPLPR